MAHRLRRRGSLVCALLLALAACSNCGKKPTKKAAQEQVTEKPPPATLDDFAAIVERGVSEMKIVLSDAEPPDSATAGGVPLAPTTALTAAETAKVLSRLPKLVAEVDDTKQFAKRAKSLPPPRTGETVKTSFPPASDRQRPSTVAQPDSALKLVRKQPEGEVPIAPHVSVTFNKPMITIASHADTIAENVPVSIDPQPPGQWRWVGSKTLLFEPEGGRFPMSTKFEVQVPAGTTASTKETLSQTESWSFTTPTLTMKRYFPTGGTFGLDQLVFIEFDQKIDAARMLKSIKLKAGTIFGSAKVELATPERINADERIKAYVESAEPGRYIVLQPTSDLPYDTSVQVIVQKGAPSAEGPRTTPADSSFSFQTYGPFEVTEHRCGYRGCNPHDAFQFRFSNRIDDEKFDESLIQVEPSFPTMTISQSGNWLYINGRKPGRRTYKVTIDRALTDEFDQKLTGKNTYAFDVGPSVPAFYSTAGTFNVLDPSADPAFTVFSTNFAELRLKAWKVEPRDWGDYLAYMHDYRYYGKREVKPPGKLVVDEKIAIDAKPDELVETAIELSEALGETKRGNLVLFVSPTKVTAGSTMPEHPPEVRTWVQATEIGIDALVDAGELIGWATSLDDGEPLGNANLELAVTGQKATTDDSGIARFDLVKYKSAYDKQANVLIASHGDERAFLPENMWGLNQRTGWVEQSQPDRLAWFTFDDRGMYRPKETVTIKGWMRAIENREEGMVKLSSGARGVSWTVYGPQGNEITKGETKSTALGGFSFDFDLPETPNLGRARVVLTAQGATESSSSTTHYFDIQEFRTPEFEVTASAGEGPHYATESAIATVEAKYYAGGALPGAQTTWNVSATAASFSPPNLTDYTFGSWTPWWARTNTSSGGAAAQNFSGKTDTTGEHSLRIAFGDIEPPRPMSVRAQATVMDVNRQAWSATTNFIVHPSQYYVGLKTDRYFVEKGDPLDVELVVADVDGNEVTGRPVKVRAARVAYKYQRGKYEEVEKDLQECDLTTTDALDKCTFETSIGGRYRIVATTVDDYGRRNFSEFTRWVSGGKRPISRNVEMEPVEMIPDKDEYRPGDTAEILIQSPIVPAEGLYTLQRNGMVEEHRFTMSEPTTTLNIPIKNTHFPNLTVQVNVVGKQPRLDDEGEPTEGIPPRPAYGTGSITLKIPPHERRLSVDVTPAEERVAPAAKTSANVVVKDASGKPVRNAEVALVVVDEAILALSSYQMGDPLNVFYPNRPAGVRAHYLRQSIRLADPAALQAATSTRQTGAESDGPASGRKMKKPAPSAPMEMKEAEEMPMALMGDMAPADDMDAGGLGLLAMNKNGGDGGSKPIAVRSNFNPLAVFAPAKKTDASGKVKVSYEMPDNLTRYRIMAVAVADGTHYGTGESNVTARLPLMVRPSAPRFLNFGDQFELPVVLQNQTDEPMTVNVASRATNIEMAQSHGWKVEVPPNDRVEVRFPASTEMAGTARFQVGASAGPWSDASEFSLPVWTPATSEAFATYGVIDEGSIVQPVAAPTKVWPQFGGLEITTSSTALQALTDAFLYLYDYDYECAEQISSRMVSVAALRDVLSAFQAEGMPSAAEVQRSMSRDIEELASRQNYDGGFGLWRAGQPSWPYVTIHATHALARAKQKGYDVPDYVLNRAKSYLQRIENYIPGWWSKWLRLHAISYSLYVRGVMGDDDPAKAREVIKRGGKLDDISFESTGWLLGVMTGKSGYQKDVAEIRRFLNNRVTETAAGAHFAARTTDSDYVIMHSDRVADGVILEAMIEDQPKSNLIPKIVNGLLAHRKKGRWGNTQENAFILLALDRYFNTFEKQTPDFVARVWLGDRFAGEHEYKGRTTERHHVDVPMQYVVDQGSKQKLYLQKDGKGRMYYRIGMNYAPKSLYLEPADHGFVIERAYEPVDDDDDVRRRSDGTWEIKAGAKIRVKLTMVAPTRRYHVALVDPLPAGLETMNPALATTGDIPQSQAHNTGRSNTWGWWWWTRPWFEHQNMRDERTEAFTTLLWGGVHTYTYYARATTPGQFVVPPTKAEEMYHPETFGRSASDRVAVVD